jgi:hypothetical protein
MKLALTPTMAPTPSQALQRPTAHAVWMVNRILNSDLPPQKRQFYLDLLASVEHDPAANKYARDRAEHYIKFQTTGNA